MSDEKQPTGDAAIAVVADKLKSGQPMQAQKFTNEPKETPVGADQPMPDIVGFDQVLPAVLNNGKSAYRKIWLDEKTKEPICVLVAGVSDRNNKSLFFKQGDRQTKAGLHGDDLVATDWVII